MTFTFLIGSREIHGDATTVFYGDDGVLLTFAALTNGARVEVKGEMRDGFVFAVRIHVNGPTEPPQDDSASVEGVLGPIDSDRRSGLLTLTSSPSSATVKVTTTTDTVVQRRGDVQSLDGPGARADDSRRRHADAGRTIVAKMLQIKDDATDGEFVIEGSLGGLKGACPAITLRRERVHRFPQTADDTAYVPDPAPAALRGTSRTG